MKKYPSIPQFREVVKSIKLTHDFKGLDEDGKPIYKHTEPYPILQAQGTVKVHGTNAAIVVYKDGSVKFQSRERELELTSDNAGFMLNMMNTDLSWILDNNIFSDYIAVYGEWCGQGIQKGVAVSQLSKKFIVFGVKIDNVWVKDIFKFQDNKQNIYNINQFDNYSLNIDFNNPELSQNKLIELTSLVEQECPVGWFFGIKGIGEGIVWTINYNNQNYLFKVKGEKHSVTNVKTLASVNVEEINSINEFIENTVTENRLNQGLEHFSLDNSNIGDFVRWVIADIIKEETHTIVEKQLDVKKVNTSIPKKATLSFRNK